MTKVFGCLVIFLVSFFILSQPHSLMFRCPLLLVNLLKGSFCSANSSSSCRETDHLQQSMYGYSSKQISDYFAILIQRYIQMKSLSLDFESASQLHCSQEWVKCRNGYKYQNNLTFGSEVHCFNCRPVLIWSFDAFQNKTELPAEKYSKANQKTKKSPV